MNPHPGQWHRIRRFKEYEQAENAPYRYICLDCGKKLKIMSGVLVQPEPQLEKKERIKELIHLLSRLVPELFFLVEPAESEQEEIAEWDLTDEAAMYDEALHILERRNLLAERQKTEKGETNAERNPGT